MGRERAETCRRLGLVRGSGRGDEGYAGHGLQHGRRVSGGEGLRCRGAGSANPRQTGAPRYIRLSFPAGRNGLAEGAAIGKRPGTLRTSSWLNAITFRVPTYV